MELGYFAAYDGKLFVLGGSVSWFCLVVREQNTAHLVKTKHWGLGFGSLAWIAHKLCVFCVYDGKLFVLSGSVSYHQQNTVHLVKTKNWGQRGCRIWFGSGPNSLCAYDRQLFVLGGFVLYRQQNTVHLVKTKNWRSGFYGFDFALIALS
jgi:hypothetical protein